MRGTAELWEMNMSMAAKDFEPFKNIPVYDRLNAMFEIILHTLRRRWGRRPAEGLQTSRRSARSARRS